MSSPEAGGAAPSGALPTAWVLVVEDDEGVRGVVTETLADDGYVVTAAGSGEEALRLLRESEEGGLHPHLVLLDLRLGEMGGAEFADAYRRRRGPHAPIVVMTASPGWEQQVELIKPAGVIAKPFDIDDLLVQVGRALRRGA